MKDAPPRRRQVLATILAALLAAGTCFFLSCRKPESDRLFTLGEESWHRGDYEGAVAAFARLAEAYPGDHRADEVLMRLGDIHYLMLNRPDDGMVYYKDLVRLYPQSPKRIEARMKTAAIYRGKKNDCEMAVVEYQKVINDDPPPPVAAEAQYLMASCYFHMGDFQQAKTEYEIFLSQHPEDGYADDALYGLAHCLYVMRSYQQAIKLYRQVIEAGKDANLTVDAEFSIGACYEEAGLLKEALDIFKAVMEKHPNREMVAVRIDNLEKRLRKGVRRERETGKK